MASISKHCANGFKLLSPLPEPHNLSGRRIFVTGATGFVGKSLLDYCSESAARYGAGFSLVVLSRDPQGFLARYPDYASVGWLSFCHGTLDSAVLPQGPFTDVIHGAASTHVQVDPLGWIDQIVGGTRRMLDFARAVGAERFLLLSSGAVYGSQPAILSRLREDYSGAPRPNAMSSIYGQAKRMAEQLCTVNYHEFGLETVCARLFAVLSHHIPFNGPYAIGNFIRDALTADFIRVRGDGRAVRSYIYGRDMAHWLITALLFGEPGSAYNVGSDQAISIKELAEIVAARLSPGKQVIVERSCNFTDDRSIYIPDISRMQALGARIYVELDEAVDLTARRLQEASSSHRFD